jgi:transcriptional regulator with XRE-family HTH domain
MPKISPVEFGYRLWKYREGYFEIEETLEPFLNCKILEGSWLRIARELSQLSHASVASRLNINRATWAKYEAREAEGTITLDTLKRAAEALDCEFVYAIRPKRRLPFSQIVWEKLEPIALAKCPKPPHPYGIAAVAQDYFKRAKFRQEQGWSERS